MLALEDVIAISDDDLEIWSTLVVGFDFDKNLIIQFDYDRDYDLEDLGYRLLAKIDKEDAFQISSALHIPLVKLPSFFRKEFGESSNLLVPSEIECIFQKILDFVLDFGAHYKLEKTKI